MLKIVYNLPFIRCQQARFWPMSPGPVQAYKSLSESSLHDFQRLTTDYMFSSTLCKQNKHDSSEIGNTYIIV